MEAITATFTSFETARRAAENLRSSGISEDRINFLTPGVSNGRNKFPGCLPSLQREKSLKWRFLADQLVFLAESLPHE